MSPKGNTEILFILVTCNTTFLLNMQKLSYFHSQCQNLSYLCLFNAQLGARPPFAGEDTFTKFTDDMVRQYIQEEEIRSKHQTALLKLREKALIEKAKAEMAWLEMQKTSLKSKGADDLMPPLNKKQRGLWMKLKSEQV